MGLKPRGHLAICLFFIISCSKHADMDADCISEVTVDASSMANQVTPSQLAVITNLFAANNLSTSGEQFSNLDSNRYQPPGYPDSVDQVVIGAYRWVNHLPVFMWNDYFVFYNGVLQSGSFYYHGSVPGPDTSFRQSLESLRRIYQANYMKVDISGGLAQSTPRHPGSGYLDSCLTAQPGYIDATYFNPALPSGSGLAKAWKVAPVGTSFPMVIIADSTGAAYPVSVAVP